MAKNLTPRQLQLADLMNEAGAILQQARAKALAEYQLAIQIAWKEYNTTMNTLLAEVNHS